METHSLAVFGTGLAQEEDCRTTPALARWWDLGLVCNILDDSYMEVDMEDWLLRLDEWVIRKKEHVEEGRSRSSAIK